MKTKHLMDSYAIIAYLSGEQGHVRVREIMARSEVSGVNTLMNEINAGEVFYILSRRRGADNATLFLETILPTLPVTLVTNTFDDVIEAARVKAAYPLSFADCFTVATAQRENAVILTGDPEFREVEHLVDVEWLA